MASYISVHDLNNYLKRKFEADVHLEHVFLKGEISNCKLHSRGHIYFSLKDDTSVINAIMFAKDASTLKFEPADGTKVFAEGKVTVYEASGKYQIIINKMQPDGIGELYIAYEKLKKQLNEEGLFNKERKKPIPKYPKRIGIVTAPTGAAIRDILSTIKRRFPICETILFPALVQGENAKNSIVECIRQAQNYDLDVLIVGRGGGSIEDLWAFNEECVAREIYASHIPVISAVGHEVDFTIADFVADLRAPTPTGAAELAVPNMIDVFKLIENYKIRINENLNNKINLYTKKLDSLINSYTLKNPMNIYETKEQNLSNLIDKLSTIINNKLEFYTNKLNSIKSSYILNNPLSFYEKDKEKVSNYINSLNISLNTIVNINNTRYQTILSSYIFKNPSKMFNEPSNKYNLIINKLELLNPLNVLKKGYSVVSIDNKSIKSINEVNIDDKLNIKLTNGTIKALVLEKEEN